MGPTQRKKNERQNKQRKKNEQTAGAWRTRGENYFFCFLKFLSQIYKNLTVGFRRDKHEKCSTGRGLRVSTKNTGFHREFR